jgi:Na+/H+-dicarboxylate symporter
MKKVKIPFYLQILIGMVVGIAIGFIAIGLGDEQLINDWIRPLGKLFIKALVLTSVGIPAESLALIIGIDRPLDMLRTSVNVTGDVAVSVIIDKQSKK